LNASIFSSMVLCRDLLIQYYLRQYDQKKSEPADQIKLKQIWILLKQQY
jgi:hypothetical protein